MKPNKNLTMYKNNLLWPYIMMTAIDIEDKQH